MSMKHHLKNFQDFNESLQENLTILRYKDIVDIYDQALSSYMRTLPRGSLKRDNGEFKSDDWYCYRSSKTVKFKFFIASPMQNGTINYRDRHIAIFSEDPIDMKEVDSIFPSELTGTERNENFLLTRKIIEDKSKTKSKFTHRDRESQEKTEVECYSLILDYDSKKVSSTKFTLDDIKKLPEYQKMMDLGFRMISTPRQVKNMSFIFSYDLSFIENKELMSTFISKAMKDRTYWGWGIFESGVVRYQPISSDCRGQSSVKGKFDTTTLSGWSQGFDILIASSTKWMNEMKKKGVVFYDTPELQKQKRGTIKGREFGF